MSRSPGALALLLVVLTLALSACNDVRSMRRNRDVDGLVGLLSDPDDHVRVQAVDALGYLGDSHAVGPLIEALRDRSPYVREHAARLLGCDDRTSLGCTTAEPAAALLELLDDPDVFIRVEAARSLGEHPLTASREPLERVASRDPRPEARRAAAQALGRIASVASRPVLETLAADRDPQVAHEARTSLEAIDITARAAAARSERPGGPLQVDVDLRAPVRDAGPGSGDAGPADGGRREP